MRTIEVSAKTRELAIKNALEQLGVERDEVHVEILDEGSPGLFGFGARNVKLKVTTEVPGPEPAPSRPQHPHRERPQHPHERAPRHEQASRREHAERPQRHQQHQQPRQPRQVHTPRPVPVPKPVPERKPAPAAREFNGPPDVEAEALLREVIQRMGIEATITSATGENGAVSIKVESPDSAILIGRKGRSLESLQYLMNRMAPRTEGDEGERITIDIEGYLDRRQEALEDLAHRLADRARETGRRQRTKPMSAQERRAIHVALEGDETVRTFSVGDSGERYVIIAPKDEKPGDNRSPRNRGQRGGERRDRGSRPSDSRPARVPQASDEGGDPQQRAEGNGTNRRRRYRRGGRGRGPRPGAPVTQNESNESGPQDS